VAEDWDFTYYTDEDYEEAIRAAAVTGERDPKAPGFAEQWLDWADQERKRRKEAALSEGKGLRPGAGVIGANASASLPSESTEES
jgi:hypothetical protein